MSTVMRRLVWLTAATYLAEQLGIVLAGLIWRRHVNRPISVPRIDVTGVPRTPMPPAA